ncbi:J domain-containing protein [Pseudobacteriovorax antillogorgiicola]|uniref:DnaJ domain-containing protein n=1 Tax=Pseudobacteriovorax antillogorgiicola TaxID=1513793 RepID=A0A1Y6CR74_9BACT|nr:J domain-containing protein [Pseudobacteriovorax antillogorgiicola]TCS41893.1 hypothetical protein EDD56_1457 [Pseudobacteriovorax antillogorgiicola]SMF83175.1 hypothetical protein SAMN06296036_1455 [Pseudobacteriovorax antillogorgiicola]
MLPSFDALMSLETMSLQILSHLKPPAESTSVSIAESPLVRIRDLSLLSSHMPRDELRSLLRSVQGQQLTAFAVRHVATNLSILAHYQADPSDALADQIDETDRAIFMTLFDDYLKHDLIPVVGFDPTGVLVKTVPVGTCRAFDSYDLPDCSKKAQLFCSEHTSEQWWLKHADECQFTQSKMFHFYSDPKNSQAYSDEEMEAMIDDFWKKFSSWQDRPRGDQLLSCLMCLDIPSVEHLKTMSQRDLQKAFYKKSLALHPDQGGQTEDFLRLKESYERLKSFCR